MFRSAIFILLILHLVSCAQKEPEEITAIGILGYRQELKVGENSFLEIRNFNHFVFHVNDSIFTVEIDTAGRRQCFWIDFKDTREVNYVLAELDSADIQVPPEKFLGNCAPPIFYLGKPSNGLDFAALFYEDVEPFLDERGIRKKVPLPRIPKKFEAKMFEMDSRYLRHYFSEEYPYPEFRVKNYIRFQR